MRTVRATANRKLFFRLIRRVVQKSASGRSGRIRNETRKCWRARQIQSDQSPCTYYVLNIGFRAFLQF